MFSLEVFSQQADSLNSYEQVDTTANSIATISFREYFKLLKQDFIIQAESPFRLHRHGIMNVTGFALITGGVMSADEPINHFAVRLDVRSGLVRKISPAITKFGGAYNLITIGAIGAYGYLFKNEKLKTTTLLATQSYITSGVWVTFGKFITGRSRPSVYDVRTLENESSWHGFLYQFRKNSTGSKPDVSEYNSFPSGHSSSAFSVATVYAEMYKDKPWVPLVAYGGASLISLSRITENKHWASDVLVGSMLGYLCGKQVVRNYHQQEKLQALSKKRKNSLSFNLSYEKKSVMTQFVYTFN